VIVFVVVGVSRRPTKPRMLFRSAFSAGRLFLWVPGPRPAVAGLQPRLLSDRTFGAYATASSTGQPALTARYTRTFPIFGCGYAALCLCFLLSAFARSGLRFTPWRAIFLNIRPSTTLQTCNLKCDLQSRLDSLDWPAFGRRQREESLQESRRRLQGKLWLMLQISIRRM
jgi:hypothetical protein